jgi:hypothetical protein
VTRDRFPWAWIDSVRRSQGAPLSLANVCAAAVTATNVDGCSVTLMASAVIQGSSYATDPVAQELDEWQMTFGEGPGLDAVAAGGPVLVADLREPEYASRWLAFTPAALGSGVRAVFALPVQVGAIRLGTLNLYRASAGPLVSVELAEGLALADLTGTVLLDDTDGARVNGSGPHRPDADPTAHHVQVHQATGMVLVQLGVSADVAFARLRAYVYAHGRRLSDVARDVVERRLRFEPEPPVDRYDDG